MQPYFLPYIGYFQLIQAVDRFVLYDDVNYITRGYINRNSILLNGQAHRFTLAVNGASQNQLIRDVHLAGVPDKFLNTIQHAYGKAPQFSTVFPMLQSLFVQPDESIAALCQRALQTVMDYLGISTRLLTASSLQCPRQDSAAERLIAICKQLGANQYINSPGGRELYHHEQFARHGIDLQFIQPQAPAYTQGKQPFVANLSIIDPLMWCSREQVIDMLTHYSLARE
jgi:hypothetical protein